VSGWDNGRRVFRGFLGMVSEPLHDGTTFGAVRAALDERLDAPTYGGKFEDPAEARAFVEAVFADLPESPTADDLFVAASVALNESRLRIRLRAALESPGERRLVDWRVAQRPLAPWTLTWGVSEWARQRERGGRR
jgi:hypothetical protein